MTVLIETQYLPSIEFFCAVSEAAEIQIEVCEHFVKQSYRNHTFIKAANRIEKLTVPLTSKGNRVVIHDVKVDDSLNWRNNHWRTIESAYRKSPYYEHYVDDLHKIIFSDKIFLIDLNHALLNTCLRWLRWEKKISFTESYHKNSPYSDVRNTLLSKKSFTDRNYYRPMNYTQVFGKQFVPNLSLLDLIFCKGPQAVEIIRASSLNL